MSKQVDDPLLDHNYDGIQEYDNPLPGWWKLLFWGSIIFAIPYVIYFHMMDGHSILDKLEIELAKQPVLDLSADAETILAMRDDTEKLELVEGRFKTICAACHKPDGTGLPGLGSNLTDMHWLNVKSLPDIYRVINEGVPGTAMVAQSALSKDEKVLLAAYVARLAQTPKEGKEAEGEEILGWPVENAKAGDSPGEEK